jgi:osmotically-inducible protein OsmY
MARRNMPRLPSIVALTAVLALPSALGGCVGVVVGGMAAAAGGGYVVAQERGADGLASDFAITNEIRQAIARTDATLDAAVTITVYDGRVLLTGQVPAPALKIAAARLAHENPRVRAVYDEIEVAGNDTFFDDAKDAWIGTQVRSGMVLDSDIRAVNYMIQAENGSVYLIGTARTQSELQRVTDIARHVRGVKRVVSYVELRPGAPTGAPDGAGVPVAAGPQPVPPPSMSPLSMSPSGPARPATVPRTPIAVEKL